MQVSLSLSLWLFGNVGDKKHFLRDFKERLRQNLTQDWFSHLSQSTRFEMYHCFKRVIGREEYLDLIKVNIYRTALAFRGKSCVAILH